MAKISKSIIKENNLTLVKTSKYKNVSIYLRFAFEYDYALKAKLSVLSNMLGETSLNYPTKESMARQKDMLYGFIINTSQTSTGNVLNLNINYDFINPKFLSGVTEDEFLEMIDETLYRPLFSEDFFNETIRNMKAAISRDLDVPSLLAGENFIDEVSKDYPRFRIYSHNYTDILNTLTLKDIEDTYKSLFDTMVDIYLIGDYSPSLVEYLSKIKSNKDIKISVNFTDLKHRDEIDLVKDVSQSTLIVSYSEPYSRTDKMFYAFNLANIMLGGIPSSLLFSEVREKNSLCYSIAARGYRYDGLVIIKTEIDANNKVKALEEIYKQVKRMRELDFDSDLLDVAKLMLINSVLSIDDDLDYFVDFLYGNKLNDIDISVDEYITKINSVTLQDIKEVMSNYKEYLVYFLEGSKHE